MSQHLTNAVASLTREIERLTEVRDQLIEIAGSADAEQPETSQTTKRGAAKRTAKKTASAQGSGRRPVSEETRKKMADARRAYFAKKAVTKKTNAKKPAAKNAPGKKTAAKKTAAKKTVAKKTVAKRAVAKKSAAQTEV